MEHPLKIEVRPVSQERYNNVQQDGRAHGDEADVLIIDRKFSRVPQEIPALGKRIEQTWLKIDPIMVEPDSSDRHRAAGCQCRPGRGRRAFSPVKATDNHGARASQKDRSGYRPVHSNITDLVIEQAPENPKIVTPVMHSRSKSMCAFGESGLSRKGITTSCATMLPHECRNETSFVHARKNMSAAKIPLIPIGRKYASAIGTYICVCR